MPPRGLLSRLLGRRNDDDEDRRRDENPFLAHPRVGAAAAEIVASSIDDVSDESLLKIVRQLDFWAAPEQKASDEEVTALARRLVRAATWRSRPKRDVPRVRFGRTEISMPIVTCGGMRLQQSWIPDDAPLFAFNEKKVLQSESQRNLRTVIRYCVDVGLNHFETARMYGTSESQFVDALCGMMEDGSLRREDFVYQTKVKPRATVAEFRKEFDATWRHAQRLGYVDLFAFHVVSKDKDVDWVLDDGPDAVYPFVKKEYVDKGLIKHVGFSTHGTAETIFRLVDSNRFDYVNLHHHLFGSYHAHGTPDGDGGHGNARCLERARELDMGLFLISPVDKGGKLFRPSVAVARAIGPTLSPIGLAALHAWTTNGFHTASVGFGRPSDLDEILEAAALVETSDDGRTLRHRDEATRESVRRATTELERLAVDELGRDWRDKGLLNLPSCYDERTDGVALGHVLWLHDLCVAYGMYDFCRDRYASLERTGSGWSKKRTFAENLDAMDPGNSGCAYDASILKKNDSSLWRDHFDPEGLRRRLADAHDWLSGAGLSEEQRRDRGWTPAYDLSTWEDFPGDPTRLTATRVLTSSLTGGRRGINNDAERRRTAGEAAVARERVKARAAATVANDDENARAAAKTTKGEEKKEEET